jgi:hypothetical protein
METLGEHSKCTEASQTQQSASGGKFLPEVGTNRNFFSGDASVYFFGDAHVLFWRIFACHHLIFVVIIKSMQCHFFQNSNKLALT